MRTKKVLIDGYDNIVILQYNGDIQFEITGIGNDTTLVVFGTALALELRDYLNGVLGGEDGVL